MKTMSITAAVICLVVGLISAPAFAQTKEEGWGLFNKALKLEASRKKKTLTEPCQKSTVPLQSFFLLRRFSGEYHGSKAISWEDVDRTGARMVTLCLEGGFSAGFGQKCTRRCHIGHQ